MATQSDISPRCISIAAASDALGIHRSTFYDLMNRGEVRTIKVGGRRLVPVAELDAYVGRKLTASDA